jgi:hypothetical protein
MARKPKPAVKPRHRVRWPAEQWGADARVEIDVVLRQDNDPAKIHITTTQDHRTSDHRTLKESNPQGRAGAAEAKPSSSPTIDDKSKPTFDPFAIAATNATLAAIRDGVKNAMNGEKIEVTPEPDGPPDDTHPEPPIADAKPVLTQAEIQALTRPNEQQMEEGWFEAIDAVCEKIGIYGACRWFLGAVGAGAGGATVVWAVNKMMGH